MTEYLVNFQIHTSLEWETNELAIVWISGNLSDGMNTRFLKSLKEADEPRVGILETTGIHKLHTFTYTIVVNAVIVSTLTNACPSSLAIILDDLVINIPTTMLILCETIITKTDIMTILTQSLHLIVYLLGDSTHFREAMIYKEKYFHFLHLLIFTCHYFFKKSFPCFCNMLNIVTLNI